MLTERPIDSTLRAELMANSPFAYAHLIKFERPSRPDANGKTSTSAVRYAYITDASRDVNFDDGSTNLIGVPNGNQIYLANKVLKMSAFNEQTEAKANSYSIVLDGNGIGATASASVAFNKVNDQITDVTWPANIDLVQAGFREGDKVTFSGTIAADFNIVSFMANNVMRMSMIDTAVVGNSGQNITMTLASEEIKSILLDKNQDNYSSFINREVYIYRAYFESGNMLGQPVLLFKGSISDVAFSDEDSGIQVTWGLTDYWGDFSQVKGRITSDDFHRALDQNGIPQPQSALKPEYAYDKGFAHAETSINMLATYNVQVEKQDVKSKKGFLGIGAKVKVKKYYVTEQQNTDLDFQLQAKSIPVIYGVRNTTGIPVFADTQNDKSSEVYQAIALSEGEIGGIYDVYIGGNSLICNNKADFDARSVQTTDNTVDLICRGRADRGDVLGGSANTSSVTTNYYAGNESLLGLGRNITSLTSYSNYVQPATTVTDTTGRGVFDGQSISLTSPQAITIDVFSGKPGQKAASQLVSLAQSNNFKIQNDYWTATPNATEYWGPNHRLLDTAYVVVHTTIADGETTLPDLEFIVRGKSIMCYNYDRSYSHYTKATGESADNFLLGDYVDLLDMNNNVIVQNTQIIDKWTFTNANGSSNTRYRWASSPNLGGNIPTTTKFYMRSSSGKTWTMVTWNYVEYAGTITTTLSTPLTGSSNSSGYLALSYSNGNFGGSTNGGDPVQNYIPSISLVKADGSSYETNGLLNTDRILNGRSWSSSQYVSNVLYGTFSSAAAQAKDDGAYVVSRNTIKLNSDASGSDDYYNGYIIRLYRYNAASDRQVIQEKNIIDYNGSTRTATIDDIWDPTFFPRVGDTVQIVPRYCDSRVSTNPAMQTMDYMTSTTYGKGLDPMEALDLDSWLEAGRACDTQSNVTVLTTQTSMPTIGSIYRYPDSGPIIWQGTALGNDGQYIEFTTCLGKLTNAWNNWKSYKVGELVYVDTRLYKVTAAGVVTTQPTHTSGTVNNLQYISGGLTLNSTNGGPAITLVTNGNPIQGNQNGVSIPGYSLYDSDGVDYFRLIGWDESSQRYVTRHQTNLMIDTSQPLFDNMNSLLTHFGGILRYSGGKYYLEVEDFEPPIADDDSEVRNITSDHIIGKIQLSDTGIKNAYNSLTAAYADPANKFESRNISFFNSTYLQSDRNVPKKGNVSVPGITNYYNTRILADKYLNKSRFGLTVSFNMAPRGLLLLSGKVIQLQYPRYGWTDKKFRIVSLAHQPDCTVDIVASEYDDSFYVLDKISKAAASGLAGNNGSFTGIGPPSNLTATSVDTGDETYSAVKVAWTNNPAANTKNVSTELYSSFSNQLYVTVTSIAGNILTTTTNHGLVAGELITSQNTINGLSLGQSYFINSIVSPNQFTISETKGGPIFGLTDGSNIGASMMTATLIATQPIPTNYFVDAVGGVNGRVVKYYWVRHKVVVQG